MDCIFLCVFNQKEYVDMLFMLLESIFIYGQLDDIDIVENEPDIENLDAELEDELNDLN